MITHIAYGRLHGIIGKPDGTNVSSEISDISAFINAPKNADIFVTQSDNMEKYYIEKEHVNWTGIIDLNAL